MNVAEESKVLRLVYTFFVGLLLAIFVGVGIDTFYPGPTPPPYPIATAPMSEKVTTAEQDAANRNYELKMREYDASMQPYSRNVSIVALSAAVILLAVGMLFGKRIQFIADGVTLGGLFTLLYSLMRSFASQDSKNIFAVVAVALVVVLYLGYRRFIKKAPAAAIKQP